MRSWWNLRCLTLVVYLVGCSGAKTGTEAAARKHFDAEFKKWMAGEESTATTFMAGLEGHSNPIGYEIRSVLPDKPDAMARDFKLPLTDFRNWPAFRLNVLVESKSKAGTPLKTVTTYNLTWNDPEKRWYVAEQK